MKKVLLTAALLGSVFAANAQISSGKMFITGSLNFNSQSGTTDAAGTKTDNEGYSNFGLGLRGGYYFTNNIAGGLGIDFSSNTRNKLAPATAPAGTATDKTTSMTYITPFLRYSMPLTEKFGFFADLKVPIGFGTMSTKVSSGTAPSDTKLSSFGLMIAPGVQWFVKDNLSLEATLGGTTGGLGYTSSSSETPTTTTSIKTSTSTFDLNLFTSVGFGLTWYFGGGASK